MKFIFLCHHNANNKEIKEEENNSKSTQWRPETRRKKKKMENVINFTTQIANYKLFMYGSSFFLLREIFH